MHAYNASQFARSARSAMLWQPMTVGSQLKQPSAEVEHRSGPPGARQTCTPHRHNCCRSPSPRRGRCPRCNRLRARARACPARAGPARAGPAAHAAAPARAAHRTRLREARSDREMIAQHPDRGAEALERDLNDIGLRAGREGRGLASVDRRRPESIEEPDWNRNRAGRAIGVPEMRPIMTVAEILDTFERRAHRLRAREARRIGLRRRVQLRLDLARSCTRRARPRGCLRRQPTSRRAPFKQRGARGQRAPNRKPESPFGNRRVGYTRRMRTPLFGPTVVLRAPARAGSSSASSRRGPAITAASTSFIS